MSGKRSRPPLAGAEPYLPVRAADAPAPDFCSVVDLPAGPEMPFSAYLQLVEDIAHFTEKASNRLFAAWENNLCARNRTAFSVM
ncbi:hypothetical protein [Erythrobacter sp.]|uniref:hypothetical protein n=1 Tax=Erythrobacter sp. TaxID=1042 RepID=UPI0025F9B0AE|nr:hypothetical protein [Erythrobacter sp.]